MATKREELTSRILPTYSTVAPADAQTRLTAPLKPSSSVPSTTGITHQPPPLSARAAARFAIRGTAIVTGGAGDIGFTICRALLEHGASGLAIFDLNEAAMATKAAQLRAEFPHVDPARITSARVDVTDPDSVSAAVSAATSSGDGTPPSVLVACAGIAACAPAETQSVAEWRRVLDVNATGAFVCAQAVARAASSANRPASIILTASISAHRVNFPQPQAAYNASKAAVRHLAASLAAEWARFGIRVNSVSPGYMDTILNEGEGLRAAREMWNERNVFGRMGDPEELTGAVVLLASGAGSYITGADVLVDGGQTLLM